MSAADNQREKSRGPTDRAPAQGQSMKVSGRAIFSSALSPVAPPAPFGEGRNDHHPPIDRKGIVTPLPTAKVNQKRPHRPAGVNFGRPEASRLVPSPTQVRARERLGVARRSAPVFR